MRRLQNFAMFVMATIAAISLWYFVAFMQGAYPRDLDGRYANAPLKEWFDKLSSGKGNCCSFTDGMRVDDPDWGIEDGVYWVRIDLERIYVPPDAVVRARNIFGRAVVWPYYDNGQIRIRCFMPGVLA